MYRFYLSIIAVLLLAACHQRLKESEGDRENAFYYYSKSIEELNDNRLLEALTSVNRAIEMNPNFAQFYNLKGDIHAAADNLDGALSAYKTAIEKRTNFTDVYIKIAKLYETAFNDYATALQHYRRAYASEETKHELVLNITNCYLEIGEFSIAEFAELITKYFKLEKLLGQKYFAKKDLPLLASYSDGQICYGPDGVIRRLIRYFLRTLFSWLRYFHLFLSLEVWANKCKVGGIIPQKAVYLIGICRKSDSL